MSEKHEHPCTGCDALSSRREFLRDATAAMATVLVAFGIDARQASGLVYSKERGRRGDDGTLRYALPNGDGVTIDRENEIILVRWSSAIYAFGLSCPHQRTMLRWIEKDQRFQCPKHKSKYEPDGTFISGRATRGMDRYPVHLDGAHVFVETTSMIQEDENASAWNRAVVRIEQ